MDLNRVLEGECLVPVVGSSGTIVSFLADFSGGHIAPLPGGYAVAACQEYYGRDFLRSALRWRAAGQFPY